MKRRNVVDVVLGDVLELVLGASAMVGVTAAICYLDTFIDIIIR